MRKQERYKFGLRARPRSLPINIHLASANSQSNSHRILPTHQFRNRILSFPRTISLRTSASSPPNQFHQENSGSVVEGLICEPSAAMAMQAVRVPGTMCASLGVQLGSAGGAHTSRVALLGARPALSSTSRVFSVRSGTRLAASGWMEKLGFGVRASAAAAGQTNGTSASSGAQRPDDDVPAPGREFATFGAGCFWGVELAFQRVHGVAATEVGYTQGHLDNPDYYAVCSGATGHSEVVRVQYDPKECSYKTLLDVFWKRHDPTTLNRQGNDMGTQYRSGVYFYTPEQEQAALESKEEVQKTLSSPIVTEILPAKKFYRAEEYHQQYLAKGGRGGNPQSPAKGCSDPIRCYG